MSPVFSRHASCPGFRERISIGNPLKLSPDFPPIHTVHAPFNAYGVPSNDFILVLHLSYLMTIEFVSYFASMHISLAFSLSMLITSNCFSEIFNAFM